MNIELSPGQTHETQCFSNAWDGTEVSDEELNDFVQPEALAGDKAYESRVIYEQLKAEEVQAVIPKKGAKGNDTDNSEFDRELSRRRNIVERLIGWLKASRRVFSRFEKTAVNYLAMIHIASIRFYLAELVG